MQNTKTVEFQSKNAAQNLMAVDPCHTIVKLFKSAALHVHLMSCVYDSDKLKQGVWNITCKIEIDASRILCIADKANELSALYSSETSIQD